MKKITPFLWFDDRLEEALAFYATVFPDTVVRSVTRSAGKVMSATFVLGGHEFMALNGGPHYPHTPAFSLFVSCTTQAEVDDYWAKLTADGGRESQCGWLVDKFGLSWQIIPDALGECIGHPDPAKARRALEAMMSMQKLDIAALRRAVA
ncbi:MAG: VOC family protein [Myxococcota bacterium]